MVAASRSLPWSAVWNDHAYGLFVQWGLVEVSSWFPLDETPTVLVTLAVLVWWSSALWIRHSLERCGTDRVTANLVPLALCLVPMPEIGHLGLASNVGWPLMAAAVVAVSVASEPVRGWRAWVELSALGLVAASHPTGVILIVVTFVRAALDGSRARDHMARAVATIGGVGLSWWVSRLQDPQLTYLGRWSPTKGVEVDVAARLTESGARATRGLGPVDVPALVTQLGGSLRFTATQFLPEPWASRALVTTSPITKFLQVLILVGIPCLIGSRHMAKTLCHRIRPKLPLSLAAAGISSVLVQHVLAGRLTARQYLFLPLVLLWSSVLAAVREVRSTRGRRRLVVLSLAVWFLWVAAQNYRDPFQENPRQGSIGRYAATDLWRPALTRARSECLRRRPEDVVVIFQIETRDARIRKLVETSGLNEAWFDHPVVLRCDVLGSDS